MKLFIRPLVAALALCVATNAGAVDLKTYYSKANNKKKVELKLALKDIISNHKKLGYGNLWTYYEKVDYIQASGGRKRVFDYYSDQVAYFPEPSSMNKEHTVPQSWWGSGTSVPQGQDIFQVLPSDKDANSAKSSYPLGVVVGTPSYPNSKSGPNSRMKTGKNSSGQMVFEPCDEYKGDFARIYMYVATCYSDVNWVRQSDLGCTFQKQDWPTFTTQAFIDLLLKWCREDPVSDWERTRNERAYGEQNNRNPFVDYPSLHEYIWGDSIAYAFDINAPHGQEGYDPGDNPDNPDDPDNPDNPDDPDNPDNPDAESGTIIFKELKWTATTHPTYGKGFTASTLGLTLSYYKGDSNVDPVNVKDYSEFRFYDQSVFIIEGAEIVGATFYDNGGSKSGCSIIIDGSSYSFADKKITWTGSMNPFICQANKQIRMSSMDVKIAKEQLPDSLQPILYSPESGGQAFFDMNGRYVGANAPLHRGTYVVRKGDITRKLVVH